MQHFLESSLDDLYSNTVDAFPNTTKRQHATQPVMVETIQWIPYRGVKTLSVIGNARNENRSYKSIIVFKNVNYNINNETDSVKLYASDGLLYEFERLSISENDVMVRCSCPDFRWRFQFFNFKDKCLYGNKARKYESQGGAPANPLELSGMCKHVIKLQEVLQKAHLFKEVK